MHANIGPTLLTCAAAIWALAQPAPLPADLNWLLQQGALFTPEQVAELNAGKVIARTDVSRDDREAAATAIVRIAAPMERVVAYFHQLLSYEDGEVTLAFGTFSRPPAAADLARLKLDADDVNDLQSCRPGRCNVRMGGASMTDVRSAVDWKAPDAADRASDWARSRMLAYVSSYLDSGDAALITYDDQSKPVKLADEWRGIIRNSPILAVYAPALPRYLTEFPKASVPGMTDELYWDKQHYTSLKPILGVTHMVTWRDPQRADRIVVAQKQLYASHYFFGSLATTVFLEDRANAAAPVTYVVYANRSRGDLMSGGFGGLKQRVAESAVKKSAEDILGRMKQALEAP
jgi:hypothetical protein